MSKQVPEYFKRRLADLEGCLPDGTSKNRLVFGPDAKRAHGKLAGTYKYIDPDSGQPMPFWIWETWYPPQMCGDRETWNYDFLGPYPADCRLDCCNGGYWGLRSPITTCGEYIELSEETLLSIERKQFMDIQFSMLNEVEQLAFIDAQLSERNKKSDEEAFAEYIERVEDYSIHKEKWDNDDNRVFVFPEKYASTKKGIKEAIGRPKVV